MIYDFIFGNNTDIFGNNMDQDFSQNELKLPYYLRTLKSDTTSCSFKIEFVCSFLLFNELVAKIKSDHVI